MEPGTEVTHKERTTTNIIMYDTPKEHNIMP